MTRVTQSAIAAAGLSNLQSILSRVERNREQLGTGRVINRPSDDPTGAASAMRLRSDLRASTQYDRNAQDGVGWLGAADGALLGTSSSLTRVRSLVLTGLNDATQTASSREALAAEVDGLAEQVKTLSNTRYNGRAVFAGTADTQVAFNPDGTYAGDSGSTERRVGDAATVRVDTSGEAAFGPGGALFTTLRDISAALRSGDRTALDAGLVALDAGRERVLNTLSDVGSRFSRLTTVQDTIAGQRVDLTGRLSDVEDLDLAKGVLEMQTLDVAYQAALGATAKIIQPSLMDFLR